MTARKNFPELNPFRDWVIDELNRRKATWPVPVSTPFVRMTSMNENAQPKLYRFFTLGLHGYTPGISNIFDETYSGNSDVVGYAYEQTANGLKPRLITSDEIQYEIPSDRNLSTVERQRFTEQIETNNEEQRRLLAHGQHSIPGVRNVTIRRSGMAGPVLADVQWVCYNQHQLEYLRNHFMVAGSHVVLEWGQKYTDKKNTNLLDFTDTDIIEKLLEVVETGRNHILDTYVKPNAGNYDFIVGSIGDFRINYNAQSNYYEITTTLVSVGENVWGISTGTTFTNQQFSNENPAADAQINSIKQYFYLGGGFDQLVSRFTNPSTRGHNGPSKVLSYVTRPYDGITAEPGGAPSQVPISETNPQSDKFISWRFLVENVLQDVMGMIISIYEVRGGTLNADREAIKIQTLAILNSILDVLRMNIPPEPGIPNYDELLEVYTAQQIGYNRYLRSSEPEKLLIITDEMKSLPDVSTDFFANGTFTGKLDSGIWINCEYIRECFLQSDKLLDAFDTMLRGFNDAVSNYWNLQTYFDDDVNQYRVIDRQYSQYIAPDDTEFPIYAFSAAASDHGDVVDMKFDSAFPPEMITQMALTAYVASLPNAERSELYKTLPLLSQTTPFMFAINWTNQKNLLANAIAVSNSRRTQQRNTSTAPINPTPTNPPSVAQFAGAGGVIGAGITQDSADATATRSRTSSREEQPPRISPDPRALANINVGFKAGVSSIFSNRVALPTPPAPGEELRRASIAGLAVVDRAPPILITSTYGPRNTAGLPANASPWHAGIDVRCAIGTQLLSLAAGRVVKSGGNEHSGELITLEHIMTEQGIPVKYQITYKHLSIRFVKEGETVRAGDVIGLSGNTGVSSGPHLHLQMMRYISGMPGHFKFFNPVDLFRAYDNQIPYQILPDATDNAPDDYQRRDEDDNTVRSAENQRLSDRRTEILTRFSNTVLMLVALNPDQMRSQITTDGYNNLNTSNGFVSPYPTKTKVNIKIPGISGISIADAFIVNRLPYALEKYGVFQVVELTEDISEKGWYTNVGGYFKLMWPAGKSIVRATTTPQPTSTITQPVT